MGYTRKPGLHCAGSSDYGFACQGDPCGRPYTRVENPQSQGTLCSCKCDRTTARPAFAFIRDAGAASMEQGYGGAPKTNDTGLDGRLRSPYDHQRVWLLRLYFHRGTNSQTYALDAHWRGRIYSPAAQFTQALGTGGSTRLCRGCKPLG